MVIFRIYAHFIWHLAAAFANCILHCWMPVVTLVFDCRFQVQMNNLSPKFAKSFDVVWQFEIRQDIEIYVYDWDAGDVRTCDVNKQVSWRAALRFLVQAPPSGASHVSIPGFFRMC